MRLAALIAFTCLSACAVKPAHAHGAAAWIMENAETVYCCGVEDCERAPTGAIVERADGSHLVVSTGQVFERDHKDVHRSVDETWWWCRPSYLGGKAKCIFPPARGS